MGTEQQWTVDRSKGIGASEMAAVMGLSSFAHAVEVWERKTGRARPSEDNHHTLRGRFYEQGTLDWLAHESGMDVRANRLPDGRQRSFVGAPDILFATPDAIVYDGDRAVANVDVKFPLRTWKAWFDDAGDLIVPDEYVVQLVAQGYCMRTDPDPVEVERHVSGAFLGDRLRFKVLERDPELESYMVEQAQRWWRDYVVADKPPPVDGSPASTSFLARFFPEATGEKIEGETLDPEEQEKLRVLIKLADEWRAREKDAGARLETYKNELKLALGDRAGVIFKDRKITWTNNKQSESVNWKAAAEELLKDMPATEAAKFLKKHTQKKPGARVLRFSIKAGSTS